MFALLRYLRRLDANQRSNLAFTSTSKSAYPASVSAAKVAADSSSSGSISSNGNGTEPGLIMCNFKPRRRVSRSGKWKSSLAERRYPFWPPFCLGLAYLLTGSLVPTLYLTSFRVPFLWLDDVYVTGFLPLYLGRGVVRHAALNGAYVGEASVVQRMLEDAAVSGGVESRRRTEVASAAAVASAGASVKTRTRPMALFSHVHNLQLFIDVWNGLLELERRKRRTEASTRHSNGTKVKQRRHDRVH